MKHIITLFLVLLPLLAAAQEFAVASFDLREMDLTAINEATKVVDDNNEVCALIKIETTEKGFFFDGGSVGIAKVDDSRPAEIWVYVPAGLRKISIMNNKFGIIRDYYFPMTLVSARTYVMKLKTPDQKSDKRLEEKTDSLQVKTDDLEQKMAAMEQQMQQLLQNQQQGNSQANTNTATGTKTTKFAGVIIENGVLKKVPEKFKGDFVIGDEVTSIGAEALYRCSGLTSVTIPNSVTSIDEWAFSGCTSLTSVTFQGTKTKLFDKDVFSSCKNLQTIYVPKGSMDYYKKMLPSKLKNLIVEQ